MFMPVSRPGCRTEFTAESVVGRRIPTSTLRYSVQHNRNDDLYSSSLLSDATRHVIESNLGAKGLQNSNTSFVKGLGEVMDHTMLTTTVSDAVYTADMKKVIADVLEFGDTNSTSFSTLLQAESASVVKGLSSEAETFGSPAIHALGKNNVDDQQTERHGDKILPGLTDVKRVGLSSFENPADSVTKQSVFDLSSVFNPAIAEDVELFGFLSDNDDSDVSDATFEEGGSRSGLGARLELGGNENSNLDAELDAMIGYTYSTGEGNSILNTTKWRSREERKSRDDDIWASDDKMDVSDFTHLVPDPVIEFPFNLDVFQKRAVFRLERDESVFVAAHTSAGKTVVAEYAIALAMQRRTKVIYTSPIKTLSNQKFRDFRERFEDVGIITGDISINPNASCLIMTTEILRSMLYKGADLIRDLSHVIFDECHWLNDPERGVVWEEAIILLPPVVNIVMLSATVPNAMEFAKWVGRTKQKPVFVVYTAKRPVPLSHQLFVKGEVFPLFESSQGRFLDANYRRASAHHKESTKNANIRFGGGRSHAWMPIIKYLQKRSLDPAIFFCFSKKKCNEAAEQLHTQDLTAGATDKNQIHLFYQSAIVRLSAIDRQVPQISRHREMLKRGIGVHHAGVLPIIKEITEVLFQQGLIRVLFATETFAMGVNMPARTVVFTAIHKFDSQGHRLLEPGEYVQMAGRAGRRGLDDVGTVLLFPAAANFPTEGEVKSVLNGTPKPLRSQFRLTYNMILNLLRIDELRVEDLMARSFSEAPAGRTSGTVKKLLETGKKTLDTIQSRSVELDRFRGLYQISCRIELLSQQIGTVVAMKAKNSTHAAIGAGHVVIVRGRDWSFRVGTILKAPFASRSKGSLSLKGGNSKSLPATRVSGGIKPSEMTVKVLVLHGGPASDSEGCPFFQHGLSKVNSGSTRAEYNVGGLIVDIQDLLLRQICAFSSLKIDIDERGLVPIRGAPNAVAMTSAAKELYQVAVNRDNWSSLPQVDPIRDLGLNDLDTNEQWEERQQSISLFNEMIFELVLNGAIFDLQASFERLSDERTLESKLDLLRVATSDESLQLMPDYKQRVAVLRKLGYVDEMSVLLKGRAACEVNTCESIILTELIFEKVLQNLDAVDLAALLSVLVFHEKVDGDETSYIQIDRLRDASPELYNSCQALLGVLSSLGTAQSEGGLPVSAYEYVRASANFGFILGVRGWAKGNTFGQVCDESGGIAEGTIVRTIVRLCELLREAKNVGRCIGDPDLQGKCDEAIRLVRRDVIFAASLYLQ